MLLAHDQLTTVTFLRAKKRLHSFVVVNAFSYLESSSLLRRLKGNEDPGYEDVVNGEFTKTLKKVDSSSRDSCCLIYGINFKLSGQGSFF